MRLEPIKVSRFLVWIILT